VNLTSLAQRWSVAEAIPRKWLSAQQRLRVLTADTPPQVRVPVFGPEAIAQLAPICDRVAECIVTWLLADTTLEALLERCSFGHGSRPAVLCMLWHNAYYEATDRLIAQGTLAPFLAVAEGEWGVWLTSHPYGRERTDGSRRF
jgi:hypothetical protein